jgi:hypothetical protein
MKARAPSNMSVGQGTGGPVSQTRVSKMKMDACHSTAQMERPRQAQRIGCGTSAGSSQKLDTEGFYFFSSGPKGLWNQDGCTRHDNGLMDKGLGIFGRF